MKVPKLLAERKQWVSWNYVEVNGRKTKVPLQANGKTASSTDSSTWDTLDSVQKRKHEGVGFVFTGGVVGIDLDKCFDENNEIKPWAKRVLDKFDSYTELSPSGKGLHILALTDDSITGMNRRVAVDKRVDKDQEEGIEAYTQGRFFTFTGNVWERRSDIKKIEGLAEWRAAFDKPKTVVRGSNVLPDDIVILDKMRRSRNGQKFQTLYDRGDWESLGFPSQSEADFSMAGFLMFFCCNDVATADRLFKQSKLYRPKWDEKHGNSTYGNTTLERTKRPEVMNWVDPACDDPQDLLREIKLYGDITIEKTDVGFIAHAPVQNGMAIFSFSSISVSHQGIEVVVRIHLEVGSTSSPFSSRIDIRSNNAQSQLVTRLNGAYGRNYNWALVANNVFTALADRLQSEQTVSYMSGMEYTEPEFLLYPFLQKDAANMFFAQPETGKSWMALLAAVCIASGTDFLNYCAPTGHKTLYIDYEDNPQVFSSRLHRLCEGLGLDYKEIASRIGYYNPDGAIKDNIDILRQQIADGQFSLVVIDAGGDASGGSPMDEKLVIELFNSLKSLPATKLILHHEPKSTNGVSDENSYYGTMYWRGRSRVAWRMLKEASDGRETIVKMILSKKSNLGHVEPLYVKIEHEDRADALFNGRVTPATRMTITEEPEKPERAEENEDILGELSEGPLPFPELQYKTGMSRSTLQRALASMEAKGLVRKMSNVTGRGNKTTYEIVI